MLPASSTAGSARRLATLTGTCLAVALAVLLGAKPAAGNELRVVFLGVKCRGIDVDKQCFASKFDASIFSWLSQKEQYDQSSNVTVELFAARDCKEDEKCFLDVSNKKKATAVLQVSVDASRPETACEAYIFDAEARTLTRMARRGCTLVKDSKREPQQAEKLLHASLKDAATIGMGRWQVGRKTAPIITKQPIKPPLIATKSPPAALPHPPPIDDPPPPVVPRPPAANTPSIVELQSAAADLSPPQPVVITPPPIVPPPPVVITPPPIVPPPPVVITPPVVPSPPIVINPPFVISPPQRFSHLKRTAIGLGLSGGALLGAGLVLKLYADGRFVGTCGTLADGTSGISNYCVDHIDLGAYLTPLIVGGVATAAAIGIGIAYGSKTRVKKP